MKARKWNSILAVVPDPSRRDLPAVEKAGAIAARCGARVRLLHTFMVPEPSPEAALAATKDIVAATVRERCKRMEQLAARLRRRGIEVDCAAEWDYPVHDAIVRQVLAHKPDLVVLDSHRHGRIARWLLANTDWELIRHCPCPLWFVRSRSLPKHPTVLVAVDPRHAHAKPARLDDRLLGSANDLVAQLGGTIDVAHAYSRPVPAMPGTSMEPVRLPADPARVRRFVTAVTAGVRRLAARHGVKPKNIHVLEGEPTGVLEQLAAKLEADIVLMGAVSRRAVARPFIGSTAEKLIDRVDCDVLIVKPAGFKSRIAPRPRTLR